VFLASDHALTADGYALSEVGIVERARKRLSRRVLPVTLPIERLPLALRAQSR
jgi:hypothetical protein